MVETTFELMVCANIHAEPRAARWLKLGGMIAGRDNGAISGLVEDVGAALMK
jgi:hypothetical protein